MLLVEVSSPAVHHLKAQQRVLFRVQVLVHRHLLLPVIHLLELQAHFPPKYPALLHLMRHLICHQIAQVTPPPEVLLGSHLALQVPHLLEARLPAPVIHHPADLVIHLVLRLPAALALHPVIHLLEVLLKALV